MLAVIRTKAVIDRKKTVTFLHDTTILQKARKTMAGIYSKQFAVF